MLSHFQRQYDFVADSRNDRPSDADLIEKCHAVWQKQGFFESLSLGRFLLDLSATLYGLFFFRAQGLGWGASAALTLAIGYLLAHWFLPVLAQAFAHRLGPTALIMHKVYSFLLMGALGEILAKVNQALLERMGYDPKLSFLGKDQLDQFAASRSEEGGHDTSGLKEDEKEMIRSIFDLRETQAKEVMTPRVDVIALDLKSSWQEVMDCITQQKFSRIPVYEGDIDHVRGILHVMDLMGLDRRGPPENFRLSEFLREAYFVPRTKKIGDLMREFRQKHAHMAVVVDEYGGTAGVITLEDILEEIVGEIHDEDETEVTKIRPIEEGIYEIDPVISLDEVQEELDIELKPDDPGVQIDTLGGFILYIHGRVPEKGDAIRHKNLLFEVLEINGAKMELVRMTVVPALDKVSPEKAPSTTTPVMAQPVE